MSEFLRSNPKLDEVICNATTLAEMREAMLTELAAQGVVIRDRQDAYDVRVVPQPPTPAASLPASNEMRKDSETFMRVLYLRGNCRFEICGQSEQDLDQQEANLRALYAR